MKALARFVVALLLAAGSFYMIASMCIAQGGLSSLVSASDFEGYGRTHQPQSTSNGGQPLRNSPRPVNSPARGWQRNLGVQWCQERPQAAQRQASAPSHLGTDVRPVSARDGVYGRE